MSLPPSAASDARDVNTAFYTAIESGDLDAMERLWLDGPASVNVCAIHPGSPPLYGRPTVLRSFAALMAGTPYIQFILTDVHVTIAGDTAVVTCMEDVLTSGQSAGAVFAANRAVATKVMVYVGGAWKLWLHHASPVVERRVEPPDE